MEFGTDCPTATLVDLSLNSDVASPKTPARVTPHRKCKKPRYAEKGPENIRTIIKEKEVTEKDSILSSLENIVPTNTFNCSSNDCPTATLVDLSLNSDEASPTTPARVTPHRKCKKLGTTAKGCEEIHKVIDDKDDTGKYNILVSLENIVPLSTINCSYNGDFLDEQKFDFDVSLDSESPFEQHHQEEAVQNSGSENDDNEVFIGEVTAKEECIAKLVDIESGIATCSSPLTTAEMNILEKEANAVASDIKANGTPMKCSKPQASLDIETDWNDLFNPQGIKRKLLVEPCFSSLKVTETIPEKDVSHTPDMPPTKQGINLASLANSSDRKIGERKIKPLQRSASMRLQRTRDSGILSQLGSTRGLAPPQCSSQQAKEERRLNVPQSIKKSLVFKTDTIKQGKLKTVHTESAKASNGCLPRGPLKATEPVKSLVQKTVTSSNKGGLNITSRTATASQIMPRITPGGKTQSRRSMPSGNSWQNIKSHQTQGTGIPKPRTLVTPKKTSLSSTDENTPVSIKGKAGSFVPSLCRKSSFKSTRSLHTSASSTGSSVGSVPDLNSPRGTNASTTSSKFTVTSAITRRSLPSPAAHLSSRLKPLKLSGGNWKK